MGYATSAEKMSWAAGGAVFSLHLALLVALNGVCEATPRLSQRAF
jgi:hypothetical protein